MFRVSRRYISSSAERSKFRFYDLVNQNIRYSGHKSSPTTLIQNVKESEASKVEDLEDAKRKAAENKIALVFGGRIKGEDRQSSSRMNMGEPRVIAGIKVPDKPEEPDNCCMSGCINCVWEMFNDDVKDWNEKRKMAAKNLKKSGGVWPKDFHPPIELLNPENLPSSLAKNASEHSKHEEDAWDSVPVHFRVFAEFEKKLKAKRKKAAST